MRFLFSLSGLVAAAAAVYGAIALLVASRQQQMIFFPSPTITQTPADFGAAYEDVWLSVQQGDRTERIHGWWIPVPPGQPQRGVMLYLHGNGLNIGANADYAVRWQRLGLSVFLFDYRGYGQSEGAFPSEAAVYQDADAAWRYLTEERGIAPEEILIYGHSLGGAIAIDLGVRQPRAAGLIVESSFTSIRDMAYRTTPFGFLPIDLILTQRFDSIGKVPHLQVPVLYAHGAQDAQVPADMSEALYAATRSPKMLWISPTGGHAIGDVDGDGYGQAIREFLDRYLPVRVPL
ncbi:alpha/beta hydrolase [Thermoleptolyngbya oregonensis NK1-22]|uniref:Alpha/beta hydrolase n=1 Tax=Thermoleptolyngbya oregonensis NK1-22 TaxID=2547457 RepID=A0AA96Y2U0_9CYAN|nr:alpha/beta hydrolase [Thermoleptolyngbya oregonensis]WOB42631.1 alpha/beta hydrolase [Thermoleptolyngbya oregonensis NK1-22]